MLKKCTADSPALLTGLWLHEGPAAWDHRFTHPDAIKVRMGGGRTLSVCPNCHGAWIESVDVPSMESTGWRAFRNNFGFLPKARKWPHFYAFSRPSLARRYWYWLTDDRPLRK